MDTTTLLYFLNKLKKQGRVKSVFVIAANELSLLDFSKLPIAIIQNTDNASLPGSHWISYFVYSKFNCTKVDYFDSYGSKNPDKYNIQFPLNITNSSNRIVQSVDSILCGLFCLMVLYYRSLGQSLCSIISRFSRNTKKNDKTVIKFYKKLRKPKITERCVGQTCRSRLSNNF